MKRSENLCFYFCLELFCYEYEMDILDSFDFKEGNTSRLKSKLLHNYIKTSQSEHKNLFICILK